MELLLTLKKNPWYLFLAALKSGLLFWLAWPTKPLAFFIFFAFIPVLFIEDQLVKINTKRARLKYYFYIFLLLLIWNFSTTWWVYHASVAGAVAMLLANSFLMSVPLWLFSITRQMAGNTWGYIGFVIYWISFEYVHLSWDLSWPWLTLGNVFALFPEWVQWYEYTGVLGGSLWVLLVNLGIFLVFFKDDAIYKRKVSGKKLLFAVLLIILPLAYSYVVYSQYNEEGKEYEVVLLQPNIDPYTEKFADSEKFIPFEIQLKKFITLSEQKISPQTSFLLWPETAIDKTFHEKQLAGYPIMRDIINFKERHPRLSLLTGITSYQTYKEKTAPSETARYSENTGYYDVFNTALFINEDLQLKTYHKSKLVPGVEIMPYPSVFRFLENMAIDLGGTSGSLGRQKERTVFFNKDSLGVAPSICYESIYGDFMARYIRKGAQFIFIITNDGWWGDTPGHRQHLHYASLRAIEMRKSIARSANTGISAFINQKGDILQRTVYWKQDVIKGRIKANDKLTFYARYGDFIGRTAAWLSVVLLLAAMVRKYKKKHGA